MNVTNRMFEFISFLYNGEKWVINEGLDHTDFDYDEVNHGIIKYNPLPW